MLSTARQKQLIDLACQLISTPSLSGQEGEVGRAIGNHMQALGYDDINTDAYGNVIGIIHGKKPGPCLLYDGHMDTVAVEPNDWQHDPFGAEIEDDKIFGRGASDMKGALAAMIAAAGFWAQDCQKDFSGTLVVAGTVHEEVYEGVAAKAVADAVKPDYVVIGEASLLTLKRGQRGRAEIIITTRGKAAHSANPQVGNNAVYQMVEVIKCLQDLTVPADPVLGPVTLVLTDIISHPYPGTSVVPDACRITCDWRSIVGETPESVLEAIEKSIAGLYDKIPGFHADVTLAGNEDHCYTGLAIRGSGFYPAWLLPDDNELVVKAVQGLTASGLAPEISHYSFCTNGSYYAGVAGIPTIGFGPSREDLAHIADEYIEIDQLTKATVGYQAITNALLR